LVSGIFDSVVNRKGGSISTTSAVVNAAGGAVGLGKEQIGAAFEMFKQIKSGALKRKDGSIDLSSASNLASLLGSTGVVDSQLTNTASRAMRRLAGNDVMGAAAEFGGFDASAVSLLLGSKSTAEQRALAALKLGLNQDVSPEALKHAVAGVKTGDYGPALKLFLNAGGSSEAGKLASGASLANDVLKISRSQKAGASDWVRLGSQAGKLLGAGDETLAIFNAVPDVIKTYQSVAGKDLKTPGVQKQALSAGAELARALVPGSTGTLTGHLLEAVGGRSLQYGAASESLATVIGVNDSAAKAIGSGGNLLQNGGNFQSYAGAASSLANAIGAPKEIGAAATLAQGIATGGLTGYGTAAAALGQFIGGEVGKWVGKAGSYMAAVAAGPLGWLAGAFMALGDLFGGGPPRTARMATQNSAYLGNAANGKPSVFSVTQNGGTEKMKVKVQQLNSEIVKKPQATREPVADRGGALHAVTDPTGANLIEGEWMYADSSDNKESKTVRSGIDAKLGFVVQKKTEGFVEDPAGNIPEERKQISFAEVSKRENQSNIVKEAGQSGKEDQYFEITKPRGRLGEKWETTWRANCNPPPGSMVELNQKTGKLEIYAPASAVVPGKSGADGEGNDEFVKIWESDRGKPPSAGKQNILVLEKDTFKTRQNNIAPVEGAANDGLAYEEGEMFTATSKGGFLGIGSYYQAADGGHMVSEAGTTDFQTRGDYGFFDGATQFMRLIQRGLFTDIAFKSERGDEYVLYNKSGNDFDELTRDEYDKRVSED
jgi:hypothetical protein